ncbi:MAG TPA: MBL fold metallo-hydrolase [Planctomycetota bacterium]|nr:MBL fold metallo-hydrolase [Planctomycetota bacterium]
MDPARARPPRDRTPRCVAAALAAFVSFGCAASSGGATAGLAARPVGVAEVAALTAAPAPAAATDLQVHFIDVGTGDCIWIRTGDDGIPGNGRFEGLNIVVDGGDWGRFGRVDGYAFASEYLLQQDRLPAGSRIDWLVLTHAHSDHNGGLVGFLRDYEVANVLDPGHDKENDDGEADRLRPASAYGRFFQAAATETFEGGLCNFVWGPPAGFALDWGDELDVEILHSSRAIIDGDLNNTSLVLRVGFSDPARPVAVLLTGDAEHAVEDELVASLGGGLRATVLKAGHHGSNSSTTEDFLRHVRPAHVVICAGNQAFSGTMLPREETFERIAAVSAALGLGTQVWRTDRGDKEPVVIPVGQEAGDDTVVLRTDGATLQIHYADAPPEPVGDPTRCQATTMAGSQCKRKATAGGPFCWQHGGA